MNNHPNSAIRWLHRRRMAYGATLGGLMFPVFALIAVAISEKAADMMTGIAWPYLTFCGAIVGAYVGFATADDKWRQP